MWLLAWTMMAERLCTYLQPSLHRGASLLRPGIETWAVASGIAGLVDATLLGTPGAVVWHIVGIGLLLQIAARLLLSGPGLALLPRVRPRVLVVGTCESTNTFTAARETREDLDLRGFVPFPHENAHAVPHLDRLGDFADLDRLLAQQRIDVVLACPSRVAVIGDVHSVFRRCADAGVAAYYFPDFLDLERLHASLSWVGARLGLALHSLPSQSLALLCKRALDLVGALFGLVLLLPALTFCALAVKLTSRGPVLFHQVRVGQNGEQFRCYKFRTMRRDAAALQEQLRARSIQDGPAFKVRNDPRLTRIGGFLRRYSLDELPQMFNVLLGDMSLVGPRPPIPSEVERYTWWQRRRIAVKPGLTCIWQVWGRNCVSFKRWVEMDLYYIDNWSLWLDVKLILHTVRAVVQGTGM
jgi:exopolysaccharide biosynthesis polyprenyl glycosylphosphotransferase